MKTAAGGKIVVGGMVERADADLLPRQHDAAYAASIYI